MTSALSGGLRPSLLALCLLLGPALGTKAEETTTASPAPPAPPLPPAAPPYHLPEKIIAAVREKLPPYAPPPPEPEPTGPLLHPFRENGGGAEVYRLPDLKVTEPRHRAVTGNALLTPKGRLALALKNSPALALGNLFGLNNGLADEILLEEHEARARAEVRDMVRSLVPATDADSREINRMMREATLQPNLDWLGPPAGGRN